LTEEWRGDDGITPRCVACDEPINLERHLERLDTDQSILELQRAEQALGLSPVTFCDACSTEPGRAVSYLDAASKEVLRERLMRSALMLREIEAEEE